MHKQYEHHDHFHLYYNNHHDTSLLKGYYLDFLLIDLRENYELEIDGKVDYSIHIPLGEIVDRLNELPSRVYKDEWIDWYDFLGKEKK